MSENNNYTILAGTIPNKKIPTVPFHPLVLSFCQQLSDELTHLPTKEENQDWIALGFWLRTRNLHKLKRFLTDIDTRLGRGLTFHITPSNMPTMFLYSFIISLLSGNNNIVRISSRLHSVVIPICTILRNILEKKNLPFSIKLTSFFHMIMIRLLLIGLAVCVTAELYGAAMLRYKKYETRLFLLMP